MTTELNNSSYLGWVAETADAGSLDPALLYAELVCDPAYRQALNTSFDAIASAATSVTATDVAWATARQHVTKGLEGIAGINNGQPASVSQMAHDLRIVRGHFIGDRQQSPGKQSAVSKFVLGIFTGLHRELPADHEGYSGTHINIGNVLAPNHERILNGQIIDYAERAPELADLTEIYTRLLKDAEHKQITLSVCNLSTMAHRFGNRVPVSGPDTDTPAVHTLFQHLADHLLITGELDGIAMGNLMHALHKLKPTNVPAAYLKVVADKIEASHAPLTDQQVSNALYGLNNFWPGDVPIALFKALAKKVPDIPEPWARMSIGNCLFGLRKFGPDDLDNLKGVLQAKLAASWDCLTPQERDTLRLYSAKCDKSPPVLAPFIIPKPASEEALAG